MTKRTLMSIAVASLVAAAAGVAYATVPDDQGVIHACYKTDKGQLRVVDASTCSPGESPITWNQTGPQGPPGPPGSDPGAEEFVGRFGNNTNNAAATDGAACTLGQVLLTASPNLTAGGVAANGQLLSITQNQALFELLGTTYGGDGRNTFALPDLRGIAPNNMTYSICITG